MTEAEGLFLRILKQAVHPGENAMPKDRMPKNKIDEGAFDSDDWKKVMDTAAKQKLFPLVYDVVTAWPSFREFDIQNPQYFAAATASMAAQMQRTEAFLDLYRSFLSNGLAPITMKGIICRELYGDRGDFRSSGDEDILIEKKDYAKAVEVLTACGYHIGKQPDKEMLVVQEVTFEGEYLSVELHLNPFGTNSVLREKMNGWFCDVFQSNESVTMKGVPVRTMTPSDHALFLIFHAFKHFTGGGFGVRMMLDILLFAEKYEDRIDWKYVGRGLKDVGAAGFLADLVETGNRYLGFSLPQWLKPVCPDELLDDMFRMGIYGNESNADRTAGRMVANAVQKGKGDKGNKRVSYFRLLFPSWRSWCAWNPYLSDKPWMVVPEWFWRIGRYLRGETSTSSIEGLDKSYKIASERMELLRKYGIL